MSHLQIISLFKNKSAEEVTADEIDFVNEYLEQHPELIDTLGGQTVVDKFLLAASETEAPAVTDSPETTQALYEPPARPWIFRITALLVLLLTGWVAWFGMQQAGIDLMTIGRRSAEKADQASSPPAPDPGSEDQPSTSLPTKEADGLWHGWNIETADGSAVSYQANWTFSDQGKPASHLVPVTQGQPTTFSITRRIEKDDWLALHFEALETGSTPGLVEISINDDIYNRISVPARLPEHPYLIPLHDYQDLQLKLQLTFKPGDDKEQLKWNRLQFFKQPEGTQWYPLEVIKVRSQGGTHLTLNDDNSITAQPGGPGIETYVAHIMTSLPEVTAFQLEAFPEPAETGTRRPNKKKWHFMDTSFVLSSFRVTTAATWQKPMTGRYVKVMANEDRSYISLAEVQVLSGGKNVALQGKASQSTPDKRMGAAMAIDNRLTVDGYRDKDGKYARSMARTRGKNEPAWWKVDLGKSYDIDRIVIHSPTAYSQRISPFYVMVLTENKDPEHDLAFESHLIKQPPSPSLELMYSDSTLLTISNANTDIQGHQDMVSDSLQPTPTGWNLPDNFRRPYRATFALDKPAKPGRTGFIIYLGHSMHSQASTLGRFRLTATNAQPPFIFAPVGTIVRHQDDQPMTVATAESPEKPEQASAEQPTSVQQQADERQAAEEAARKNAAARATELQAAEATAAKAEEAKLQEAAQKAALESQRTARQKEEAARRLTQQKKQEALKKTQQKRQEALKKAQQKRQEDLRKAREKRAADARKKAEQQAARRKADAKRREDEAKKRAEREAARRMAEAKRREDEAKKRATEAKRRADEEAARRKAEQAKKSSG